MAILHEINKREFKKQALQISGGTPLFCNGGKQHHRSENAKRIRETPAGVTENSEAFVAKLLEITSFEESDAFREVLETCLVETLKDELKFCCLNCTRLNNCLDVEIFRSGNSFCGVCMVKKQMN